MSIAPVTTYELHPLVKGERIRGGFFRGEVGRSHSRFGGKTNLKGLAAVPNAR